MAEVPDGVVFLTEQDVDQMLGAEPLPGPHNR
jgi:hypothetical protein